MANKTQLICRQCGAPLDVNEGDTYVRCRYCNTSYCVEELLEDSDEVKIQKIRADSYEKIESQKIELEKMREKNRRIELERERFKHGKTSKFLIMFMAFVGFIGCYSFSLTLPWAGIICLIQLILGTAALLMGHQVIRTPYHGLRTILIILMVLLIFPWTYALEYSETRGDDLNWDSFLLGDQLPELEGYSGRIELNQDKALNINVADMDGTQVRNYLQACRDFGYTLEEEAEGNRFEAFNQEGYKLHTYYYESDETLSIWLDEPIRMEDMTWPAEASEYLPEIPMKKGSMQWNYDKSISFYVGDMDREAYDRYVDQVYDSGFSLEFERDNDSYTAYDRNRNEVTIDYEGLSVIRIYLNKSMEK